MRTKWFWRVYVIAMYKPICELKSTHVDSHRESIRYQRNLEEFLGSFSQNDFNKNWISWNKVQWSRKMKEDCGMCHDVSPCTIITDLFQEIGFKSNTILGPLWILDILLDAVDRWKVTLTVSVQILETMWWWHGQSSFIDGASHKTREIQIRQSRVSLWVSTKIFQQSR